MSTRIRSPSSARFAGRVGFASSAVGPPQRRHHTRGPRSCPGLQPGGRTDGDWLRRGPWTTTTSSRTSSTGSGALPHAPLLAPRSPPGAPRRTRPLGVRARSGPHRRCSRHSQLELGFGGRSTPLGGTHPLVPSFRTYRRRVLQVAEDVGSSTVGRLIRHPGNDMDVQVSKPISFGEEHHVRLLATGHVLQRYGRLPE